MLSYFPKRGTHANRYIGEIVILSNHIKANTARSDIAHTEHSQEFRKQLNKVAVAYEKFSNIHQESSIALDACERVETRLQSADEAPTAEGVYQLKRDLESLKNRLKQPLNNESRSRVDELIKKLESSIPELQKKLSELNGDGSSGTSTGAESGSGGEQAESENGDDTDTDVDDGDTGSSKKKRGLKENLEVTKILEELNKDGIHSAPEARKIKQLYDSLCTIAIKKHPSLTYIGTWALWEIIGATARNSQKTKSWDYLTQQMSNSYKSSHLDQYKGMNSALDHIQKEGNVNKHSSAGVAEPADLLRNKMEILDDFLLLMMKQIYRDLTGSDWNNSNSSKET